MTTSPHAPRPWQMLEHLCPESGVGKTSRGSSLLECWAFVLRFDMAMGQNLRYHFGDDYQPLQGFLGFIGVQGFDPQPYKRSCKGVVFYSFESRAEK